MTWLDLNTKVLVNFAKSFSAGWCALAKFNYQFLSLNIQPIPVRARQRASPNQKVRRQKAAILWQHKHGSRNISSHGKSNLSRYHPIAAQPHL
jgi:hypothetical protein